MLKRRNPSAVVQPMSCYAQAVEVPPGARSLHVSGQIGVASDGTVQRGFRAQAEQAFRNVIAILEDAGMGVEDVVKLTVFVTRADDVPEYREVRDAMLEGVRTASTLIVVAGLATPELLVEIEAVAASDR